MVEADRAERRIVPHCRPPEVTVRRVGFNDIVIPILKKYCCFSNILYHRIYKNTILSS